MFLTKQMLHAKHACKTQYELFVEHFPDGVEVTELVCVSVANIFDWEWAALNLLPAPLYADYKAKSAALYTNYEVKRAALYTDCVVKRAAYADYEVKRAALYTNYEAKCAALFGRLANSQE